MQKIRLRSDSLHMKEGERERMRCHWNQCNRVNEYARLDITSRDIAYSERKLSTKEAAVHSGILRRTVHHAKILIGKISREGVQSREKV